MFLLVFNLLNLVGWPKIFHPGLLLFPIFLFTNSTIIIFSSSIAPINIGKVLKLKYEAIRPNKGGINVVPIYALAICIPIIACDFSLPKFLGVSCRRLGYIGAQPSPIVKKPGNSNALPAGSNKAIIPQAIKTCPNRTIWRLLNFMVRKPEIKRPDVIPIK